MYSPKYNTIAVDAVEIESVPSLKNMTVQIMFLIVQNIQRTKWIAMDN
jgi:hypothetical protein